MNSKINIILWGVSSGASAEEKKLLYALGSPLTVLEDKEKIGLKLSDANLIIAHDGLPNSFRKSDAVWLLQTGGSKSDKPPIAITQTGEISWNTFMENITVFVSQLRSKSEIQKEEIEVLYAIYPKVEGLLEKLSMAVPFEDLWDSTLRNTKHDLQKEIKKRLA